MVKSIKKNITKISLAGILLLATFLRLYRMKDYLGFWYDQGRDALVIWDLIHKGKFFLIGPTTGLPGIFRGPFYYYLITPFYWLGNGNPLYPYVFLVLTTVAAVWLIYKLGTSLEGEVTGYTAAILAAFSFSVVLASRWLSNPTPMLLLSMILVWGMIKVTEGKRWGWPVIAGTFGLSLFSFGSSGEFFYFPALVIFLIWQWKRRPDVRNLIYSVATFGITFAPLAIFNLRHGNILLSNFTGTFGEGSGSFVIPSLGFIKARTLVYVGIFSDKIFHSQGGIFTASLVLVGLWFLFFLPKLLKSTKIKAVMLLFFSAIVGLYFYQGNYGILYDYYMTGYYLVFLLLFAVVVGFIWKAGVVGKLFVLFLVGLFLVDNLQAAMGRFSDNCQGDASICYINQLKAIDWIYSNASGNSFNVDEYVPPVIPYAYNYLFTWLGTTKYHQLPKESQIPLLYTLYEADPPHPERLDAWLTRQKTIGKVEKGATFGGITVERRQRINEK